jgi:hypothetical protein
VGAKIAAATKNPAGVIYQSWKNGEGNMVQLEKNSSQPAHTWQPKLLESDWAVAALWSPRVA